jgi:hypothetical protein
MDERARAALRQLATATIAEQAPERSPVVAVPDLLSTDDHDALLDALIAAEASYVTNAIAGRRALVLPEPPPEVGPLLAAVVERLDALARAIGLDPAHVTPPSASELLCSAHGHGDFLGPHHDRHDREQPSAAGSAGTFPSTGIEPDIDTFPGTGIEPDADPAPGTGIEPDADPAPGTGTERDADPAADTGGGTSPGPTRERILTFVYYLHRQPAAFTGGELRLYDRWMVGGRPRAAPSFATFAPTDNTLLAYLPSSRHEVVTVRCPSGTFANRRFAVSGFGMWAPTTRDVAGLP